MKKELFSIVAICALLVMSTTATAQVRRKSTTSRPSATKQATVAKCVIYDKLNASSVFIDDDCILYVEKGENNAVIAIDCKTGEKQTIIPGIAGIYEGRRPRIKKAHKVGNTIFFTLENQDGGYIYDNKSVQSSPSMTNVVDLCVTTTNHALVRSSKRLDGKVAYDLWDLNQGKLLVSFPYDELGGTGDLYNTTVFISDDGCLWTDQPQQQYSGNNMYTHYGIKRITPEGKWTFYDLGTQSYVAENNVTPGRVVKKGDYIYRAAGRRIYRINTTSPNPEWEEFAKIPPTQDSEFSKFAIDSKGNMLTNARLLLSSKPYNNQYWRAGAFDNPQNLGSEIPTGINQYPFQKLEPESCSMRPDAEDNFVFLEDGTTLYIYNPNGINGYAKTKGTLVK